MAETKILGIVSEVPMGDWNATTTYQKLNFVRHNGATYKAKTSNVNIEPGVASNWQDVWMLCNYDGGQQTVVPDGTYPEMTVGKVQHALFWGSKSYDGSSPQTITAEDLGIASVYKPKGSIEFAMLPAIPSQETEGYIWNITDNFTTDSRFLEGAGISYSAGTNVGVVQNNGAYYYDVFGNFVDLSEYAKIYGTYPNMTVGNATNVTTQINGKLITDIFETDGTTVKEASHADTADEATHAETAETATNSPKSLYNLGAYDTYVDNGDGTVTVTRKTGRYDVPINNFVVSGDYFEQVISLPNGDPSYGTDTGYNSNATSNVYKLGFYGLDDSFYISTDSWLRVFDSSYTNDTTGLAQFKAAIESAGGMYILYETTTSFTEKLPDNVSINTLDANMSGIVRDEVEKTLNLFNIEDKNARSVLGATYAISGNNLTVTRGSADYSRISYQIKTISGNSYFISAHADVAARVVVMDGTSDDGTILFDNESSPSREINVEFVAISDSSQLLFYAYPTSPTTFSKIMLNKGSHAYPYQPYNGAIVHEKQFNDALEGYIPFVGVITDIDNASIGEYQKPFYGFVNSNTSNAPSTSAGTIFTNNHSATYASQQYITDTGDVYFRGMLDGIWNGWKQVADRIWVQGNYLPLTGGTINGNLNVAGQVHAGQIYESGQRVYSPNNPPPVSRSVSHMYLHRISATFSTDGVVFFDIFSSRSSVYTEDDIGQGLPFSATITATGKSGDAVVYAVSRRETANVLNIFLTTNDEYYTTIENIHDNIIQII